MNASTKSEVLPMSVNKAYESHIYLIKDKNYSLLKQSVAVALYLLIFLLYRIIPIKTQEKD
ncbi:hypothetical protein BK708_29220 [Bacillus thuringiensis serovar yunnanensis]|nr:hypothetical protein BK708_29220 [Bacillus thuringiensis serovar yunnanensis]